MQDHTILPVIAYWVDGDTLNYITVKSAVNHVSLAEVDRDFSKQLNAERNVPFALPAALYDPRFRHHCLHPGRLSHHP